MKFDLHVHTNFSDGVLSPEEVINLAVKRGLDGIAITDHDSIRGVKKAIDYSKKFKEFNVIPGIEFSCVYRDEEVHILGYFINIEDKKLIEITKEFRNHRKKRASQIVDKLKAMDMNLDYNEILEKGDKEFIGRANIARELVEKSYAKNTQEVFNKYLNRGRSAYVERFHLSIKDTIELINDVNGIAVLAHPGLLKDKSIINYCIDMGVEGIECIHSKHGRNTTEKLKIIAEENNLLITGGSDFHLEENKEILMGKYYVDLNNIPELKERL